jgi:hypothetical protein
VALFLNVELESIVADAGLGDVAVARNRLDDLLRLHHESQNPLTHGRLHETYARVAALVCDWPTFRHHCEETRIWYGATGSASLVSRAERLRVLDFSRSAPPPAEGRSPTVRANLRRGAKPG